MNKVTTINLGGNSYQLEEPGYEKLHAYLNDAKSKLGSNPDREEIILDLERAIAEKCDTYLSAHKSVVSEADVDQIIKDMGPVHADGEQGTVPPGTAPADSPKRLYRVREGAWLFGVCAGLAAYLNIDVAIVRILAVVLLFGTHGGIILAYIIAAIFIHRADTPEKRAAAHGVPFSTQDFIARTYDLGDEIRANSQDWKRYRRAWKQDRRISRYHSSPLIGPLLAVLWIVWLFALISLLTTHAVFGLALPVGMSIGLAIALLAVLYVVIVTPLKYLAYSMNNPYDGADRHALWSWPLRFVVEFILLWFVVWLLYWHVPAVHAFADMVMASLQQAHILR
jgi:phage shock protein PspC (stress-responsive transcriptional regulator)